MFLISLFQCGEACMTARVYAVCVGSECSVQISNAATPDFNCSLMSDDVHSTTRVTRGVQTLPRSAHANRTSSTYHAGAGGSLTRPVARPRPTIVDKHVCHACSLKHSPMKSLDVLSFYARRHICCSAYAIARPSVRHTDGSVANGWTQDHAIFTIQ